jgi:Rrf2 family protein
MLLGQLFSQRVGYAVHAMCYMARTTPRPGLTTVPELAEWMRQIWPESSETYLANVIRRLVRGGLLISQRGISGGYRFAREPEDITLHDVVAVLEGVSYARCALTPSGTCREQDKCPNYQALCDLQQQYTELLAGITISRLASEMAASIPAPPPVAALAEHEGADPLGN